ncbi:hypothetical protein ACSQ67_020466 [Phaseolus vulgaris]
MSHGNSRSGSKSGSRSSKARSVSRRRESPSPSRYRRSQERRHNPSPRRKSTERPSHSRRSSSQNRSGTNHKKQEKITSYRAAVDHCIETSISLTDTRNKERTKTPSRSPSRSRSKSRSKRKGSKSPKAKTASPRRYGSEKALGYYRYRRSQERRTSPCQRRKSTERPHIPSQKISASCNQTKVTKLLLPDEQILEENEIETKALSLRAAEELSKAPKIGEIYNEVEADVKNIEKRLKYLSQKLQMLSINEANEIADAAYLLRLLRKPNNEIEMAGQMAHRGALLMLQAEMLSSKGKELLEQSKNKLKFTML